MNNTEYLPLAAFHTNDSNYWGGIFKWWFVPIEWLDNFPMINPVNQRLQSQPQLLSGYSWMGPVHVPDENMGYQETTAIVAAGVYYKSKLQLFEPGMSANSHINIGNMMNHQFCVVAQVRSGMYFIVIGNNDAGLRIDLDATTGVSPLGMPGSKIVLSSESKDRALVLSSFTP